MHRCVLFSDYRSAWDGPRSLLTKTAVRQNSLYPAIYFMTPCKNSYFSSTPLRRCFSNLTTNCRRQYLRPRPARHLKDRHLIVNMRRNASQLIPCTGLPNSPGLSFPEHPKRTIAFGPTDQRSTSYIRPVKLILTV